MSHSCGAAFIYLKRRCTDTCGDVNEGRCLSSHDKRRVRCGAHINPRQCKHLQCIYRASAAAASSQLKGSCAWLYLCGGRRGPTKRRHKRTPLSFQLLLYLCLFRSPNSSDICNLRSPVCQVVAEFTGGLYARSRHASGEG